MRRRVVNSFNELKGLGNRIINRDFRGNTGQAVKNSTYQIGITIVSKVSALAFTIIIARLLQPELFGLYGLALSTILIFASFSDLGIGITAITFISNNLSENKDSKARGYLEYLLKYKLLLLLLISLALLASSYYISNIFYNKPLFYALLAGIIYIPLIGLTGFFTEVFISMNNFKIGLIKETIFQFLRLILVPLVIILLLGNVNDQLLIASIILILTFSYLLTTLYVSFKLKGSRILKSVKEKINSREKLELKRFVLPLSVTALSGSFFGSIDMMMLGHYIPLTEFLGYYLAAFSLAIAASAILAFSATALLPILSGLKGNQLERGFKKAMSITLLITLSAGIFTYLFAEIIILAYGQDYQIAVPLLKLFSIIVITAPIIALYSTYYISQKKTKEYAALLILSTIINIVLNYVLIVSLLPRGMFAAVMGAGVATVISRIIYLGTLMFFRKRQFSMIKFKNSFNFQEK
ncbi:MAG: oligosaccharide flippase family protein [Nanoarchaeota archaeon]|nr:oligosaccharide flippase family protein [Nanoarchaeota archaeon]